MRLAGAVTADAAITAGELEGHRHRVRIEGVGHRAQPYQAHVRDLPGGRCGHVEARAGGHYGRGVGDGRARALEEIGRAEDFVISFGRVRRGCAGHVRVTARAMQHGAVGHQKGDGMIGSGPRVARELRSSGRCGRIPDFRRPHSRADIVEPAAAHPTGHQHLTVRQDGRREMPSGRAHRAGAGPGGGPIGQIDFLRGRGRCADHGSGVSQPRFPPPPTYRIFPDSYITADP